MINKIKELLKKLAAKFTKKKEASNDNIEESSNDDSSNTQEGEALAEHIDEKMDTLLPSFTEEERDALLDLVRPIIKNFNNDVAYARICKRVCDSKVLKTFSSISDDGSTLIINLTQSKIFNSKIAKFIEDKVESSFKMSIYDKYAGMYDITSEDGSILIKKVG